MIMRRCYICGEVKPLELFRTNKREKQGKGYECKQCDNAKSKQYVTINADKRNLKRRIKYHTDNTWRLKELQRMKSNYHNNKTHPKHAK